MKHKAKLLTMALLLAVVTISAGATEPIAESPNEAAAEPTIENITEPAAVYPTKIEEYLVGEEHRIDKTYQLSRTDNPALISTEDFERSGISYTLLDITRTDSVGVDTAMHTETVTQSSETKNEETVLSQLASTLDVTTAEGYAGTLALDPESIEITTDGYATGSRDHNATRSYPNLSSSDASLVPKTVDEDGRTLDLADVQWSEVIQPDGIGGTVTRYTATATYGGSSSYQYATGYTVTANYVGEVAKTDTSIVVYTAIFGGTEKSGGIVIPTPQPETATEKAPEVQTSETASEISPYIAYAAAGMAALAAIGGLAYWLKKRRGGY